MAFLSGPRQVGKTTLARGLLAERDAGRYTNWDDVEVRRQWVRDPKRLVPAKRHGRALLVLDEIHKAAGWKRSLKGLYDTLDHPVDVLVTGSAWLAVYRRGGDSLLGRYFHFRLHPFSVRELRAEVPATPDAALDTLARDGGEAGRTSSSDFDALLRFGGFPEPLLTGSERTARLWRRGRVEKVIREDLRDLTRLPELGRVEMLAALLPERVGSPLSVASLREDLEVGHETVTRWLAHLRELYYAFEVKPFARSIRRSLRKQGKTYLWDWSEVSAPGPRFENMVAGHLSKACDYWTDTGEGTFELRYLRDKQGHEIDFVVLRDGRPWFPVEAKLSDTTPDRSWRVFLAQLGVGMGVQLVAAPGHWTWHDVGGGRVLVASADSVLRRLV
jgi:hypothetical protein